MRAQYHELVHSAQNRRRIFYGVHTTASRILLDQRIRILLVQLYSDTGRAQEDLEKDNFCEIHIAKIVVYDYKTRMGYVGEDRREGRELNEFVEEVQTWI